MNTPGRPFPTSIEILESRIAPAAITFTDFDGDRVKIVVSKGSTADIRAAAQITGGQLLELDLASNPIFADADVTVKVMTRSLTSNGLADVGFLNAKGLDLGVVKIAGDLGRIKAGDTNTTDGSCSTLSVATMGARGTESQAAGGDLFSRFTGKLGTLKSTGSLTNVSIFVSGGIFNLDGQIGSIDIGGSLVGGSAAKSGMILAKGAIGTAHIAGDLVGGTGEESGSIVTERKLDSITVDGQVLGSGALSGRIFAADVLGFARVTGKVQGGVGEDSGAIASFTGIGTVDLKNQLIGGTGVHSGAIGSGGDIDSVTVSGLIQGGGGKRSGAILATGGIGTVKTADIAGGVGKLSGVIGAGGVIQFARIDGDLTGGDGMESGAVGSDTGVGKIVVIGSVVGGQGSKSGAILSGTDIQTVSVFGGIIGGLGDDSGIIGATGFLDTISIAGSIRGGDGPRSGVVGSLGGIGNVQVVEDIEGGSGDFSGAIASGGKIQNVIIEGSLIGGTGFQSGAIGSTKGIHSVAIDGGIQGFASPPIAPLALGGGKGGGPSPGEESGVILSGGDIDVVHVGGSIVGGIAPKSGAIVSFGTIGTVTVDGDIVGGSGTDSGSISGENVVTDTGATGGAIRKIVVHGNIQGGIGENSGTVQSSEDIGKVIVDGDLLGGSGDVSGSIISGGRLGKASIGGNVIGGDGQQSGVIETDGELDAGNMGAVAIGGILQGGAGPNSGTIFSSGNLASVVIGGAKGVGVLPGTGLFSGGIGAALDAGEIVINGNLQAGPDNETGKISIGGDLDTLVIQGSVVGGSGDFDTSGKGTEELGQVSVFGTLTSLTIGGSMIGGDGALSAQIRAGSIKTASIKGSISGGAGDGSGGLVATNKDIGTVTIDGGLNGGSGFRAGIIAAERNIDTINVTEINRPIGGVPPERATISAGGRLNPASNALAVAIGNINVTNTVTAADILAGYDIDGVPINPDAQIFRVRIGTSETLDSDVLASTNIVAGMTAGESGEFGDGDDEIISASTNARGIISKIASVILNGTIASGSPFASFGIVAQEIIALSVDGTSVPLESGPGNDGIFGIGGGNINLVEAGVLLG